MDESGLRYTLGAGTLLGAMRNEPPGLLQWEHDVDVYVLARDASRLLQKLQALPRPTLAPAHPPSPALAPSLRHYGRRTARAQSGAVRTARRCCPSAPHPGWQTCCRRSMAH